MCVYMGEQYPRSDFNEPTVVYKTMRISFSLSPVRGSLIHVDYRLRERERERERERCPKYIAPSIVT